MELTQEQGNAVKAIVEWYSNPDQQEFYLAGYAGVGKSTIANFAIEELRAHKGVKKVVTAAYTGKAASILHKKGIPDAQTIHSLLYIPVTLENGELMFVKRDVSDGEFADLIVIDECSMVGDDIANDVRALKKKILILGDPGQLPPINGEGAFTRRTPDAFLHEIHRQAADSPIIELATMVRQGKPLPLNYNRDGVKVLPLTFQNKGEILRPDTQVLCGTHDTRYNYTQEIRRNMGYNTEEPQPGEKIICCRTNYRWGFFNGYMGTLGKIKVDRYTVTGKDSKAAEVQRWYMDVKMDDMQKAIPRLMVDPYLFRNHFNGGKLKPLDENTANYGMYSELDWGWLITVHKAQGSGWPHVTVVDDSDKFRENKIKHLYTAITRAESGLTVLTRRYR